MMVNIIMTGLLPFLFYRLTIYQALFFTILAAPILFIFFEYNTGFVFCPLNVEIHHKYLLQKSLFIFSLYLFFFKLGFLFSNKIKKLRVLSLQIRIKNFSILRLLNFFFLSLAFLQMPPGTIFTGYLYHEVEYRKKIELNVIPLSFLILLSLYICNFFKKYEVANKMRSKPTLDLEINTFCRSSGKCLLNRKLCMDFVLILTFFIIGVIYLHFLKGHRVEPLGLVCVLFLMSFNRINNLRLRMLIYLLFGLMIAFLWSLTFIRFSGNLKDLRLFFSDTGHLGLIANTYLIVFDIIENNLDVFRWFNFFSDMFEATLPEILYPNRPRAPAYLLTDYGYSSGGGMHWFGTIYWSFGYLGFFYTFFIGTLLGIVEKYSESYCTVGNYIYIVTILISFRWFHYSSFAIYKGIIIMLFFLLVLKISDSVLYHLRR